MEKAKKLHNKIEQDHDLKPGWGYDPESFKIILKED